MECRQENRHTERYPGRDRTKLVAYARIIPSLIVSEDLVNSTSRNPPKNSVNIRSWMLMRSNWMFRSAAKLSVSVSLLITNSLCNACCVVSELASSILARLQSFATLRMTYWAGFSRRMWYVLSHLHVWSHVSVPFLTQLPVRMLLHRSFPHRGHGSTECEDV